MSSIFNSPQLTKRIIDCKDSETYDQLYFLGTVSNYVLKKDRSVSKNVNAFSNFISQDNSQPYKSKFRDILDGGDSSFGSDKFNGPIIGGEFPTEKGPTSKKYLK